MEERRGPRKVKLVPNAIDRLPVSEDVHNLSTSVQLVISLFSLSFVSLSLSFLAFISTSSLFPTMSAATRHFSPSPPKPDILSQSTPSNVR
jgi:hypothetical protein